MHKLVVERARNAGGAHLQDRPSFPQQTCRGKKFKMEWGGRGEKERTRSQVQLGKFAPLFRSEERRCSWT